MPVPLTASIRGTGTAGVLPPRAQNVQKYVSCLCHPSIESTASFGTSSYLTCGKCACWKVPDTDNRCVAPLACHVPIIGQKPNAGSDVVRVRFMNVSNVAPSLASSASRRRSPPHLFVAPVGEALPLSVGECRHSRSA